MPPFLIVQMKRSTTIRVTMKRHRTKLSLHIKHPTRDLSSVCDVLGVRPRILWKAGDERRTPTGRKLGGLRAASYCSIELGPTTQRSLPKQIEASLLTLKPHRRLLRRLASTGGSASFYVGWFCNGDTGESFSNEILEKMADLRIALDLNIYVPRPSNKGGIVAALRRSPLVGADLNLARSRDGRRKTNEA